MIKSISQYYKKNLRVEFGSLTLLYCTALHCTALCCTLLCFPLSFCERTYMSDVLTLIYCSSQVSKSLVSKRIRALLHAKNSLKCLWMTITLLRKRRTTIADSWPLLRNKMSDATVYQCTISSKLYCQSVHDQEHHIWPYYTWPHDVPHELSILHNI